MSTNNEQGKGLPGVKTTGGKHIIRSNAFKHGLRSDSLVTAPKFKESLEEYDSLVAELRASLQPQAPFEEFCIHSMAKAMFKLRRAERLETSLIGEEIDYLDHISILKVKNPDRFDLILRYRTALNNEITRALSSIHTYRHSFQLNLFGNGGANESPE